MAGGGGTRLWPLSRKNLPKQFLDLGTGKTLLEHTYDRAAVLVPKENIYIATTQQYQKKIQELLPTIAEQNVFLDVVRYQGAEPVLFGRRGERQRILL